LDLVNGVKVADSTGNMNEVNKAKVINKKENVYLKKKEIYIYIIILYIYI